MAVLNCHTNTSGFMVSTPGSMTVFGEVTVRITEVVRIQWGVFTVVNETIITRWSPRVRVRVSRIRHH